MKTIDFSKIEIERVDGNKKQSPTLYKEIATGIYATNNPGQGAFAQELYKNPVVELDDEKKGYIENYLKADKGLYHHVRKAIEELISD